MRFDSSVHERLCITRFVSFVMAQLAETDDVEDHVLVELLPVFQSDLKRTVSCLGVIAIDVKNRQLGHARHIG